MSMPPLECNSRKDPVSRKVRDLTPEEVVHWLVEYHGLRADSAETVVSNLREQFCWHRLQGRLDNNSTAGLVAQLLVMRQSPMELQQPIKGEAS